MLSAHAKMKMCLEDVHIENFSTSWENNILDLVRKSDRKKHSALIKSILEEVKYMYAKDMREFGIGIVLRTKVEEEHPDTKLPKKYKPVKEDAVVSYNKFLKRRTLLKSKYFLSLEPIKIIMNSAQLRLPRVICDFKRYHEFGIITLQDFQSTIADDIKKGSLAITNKFYVEASKAVARSKILNNISPKKLPSIMRCITNVFVQQILNIMIKSIDHIVNVMRDEQHCPQIKLQLVFQDNQTVIEPSIEDVFLFYHDIIQNIENIAQDLIPLEEWLNVKTNLRYIQIKLPGWFVEESHNKLQNILESLFQPVKNHFHQITEEFRPISAGTVKKKMLPVFFKEINFDSYLKRIRSYDVYLIKANEMLANVYYTVGKLEQNDARDSLNKRSSDVRESFVTELVMYHKKFNENICTEFEALKETALSIPKDAKSLIELSEYISQASTTLIKELEDKIGESTRMLSALLEITVLADDHIELNRRTINWLHEIDAIFAQNNTLSEAMKSELEDDMQHKINHLNSHVDEIVPQLAVLDDMDDIKRIREYVEYYRNFLKQANQIDHEMQEINEAERLFRFPETEFPKVTELKEIIMPFYALIHIVSQWQRDKAVWLDGPFEWLDATTIKDKTLSYFEKITEMSKSFKSRIKLDVTTNKCFKFSGIADDPDPMQQPAPLKLCWQALNDINEFKTYLPLVTCMCNPALQDRHWKEMSEICEFDLTPNAGSSLRKIIAFDLTNEIAKYEAISVGANRELALQRRLSDMNKEWEQMSFEIRFDEESAAACFVNLNDIELLLEEHLVKIEEMRASSFVKPIIAKVKDFFKTLIRVREIINQWDCVQSQKFSLDSVFSHPSVETRLREETSLYAEAKKTLRQVQTKLSDNPRFKEFNDPSLLESLSVATECLEKASKGVAEYMESKRLGFPRFFFLSDREMQTILFEADDVGKLCVYLNKCFGGIRKLRIRENKYVSSIFGDYQEELTLRRKISIPDNSQMEEEWLVQLESEVSNAIKESISEFDKLFGEKLICDDILNFPSMAVVCVFQIRWTSEIHACLASFNQTSLRALNVKYTNYLSLLVNKIKNNPTRRCKHILSSLIVVVSNQEEIIDLLLKRNVTKSTDFEWIARLRYYVEHNRIKASMFNTTINYGYEYNYHKQSIVNTTLTDRCFHTLMQAYNYNLYGAVIGPPATGKTETVKSLARALAIQFHVFNCNENISYCLLSRVLKGLASCGAWLCFENFGRLKIGVLSAITQNIVHISQVVATNLKSISFDGCSLNLDPTGYICVVMNPDISGYSDLPDNLKIIFRTVSMMVPDLRRIVEVELFAAGFSEAKSLALKLVALYKLLSRQLWCKSCSNFSLFSVKTLIVTASSLKSHHPDEEESMLLLRSLIDINIPKLCDRDILIFKDIVHDIFPNTDLLSANYTIFLEALETVCKARYLSSHDVFKLKTIQLFELLHVQQALMLVSEPFGGKTEILHALKDTLLFLHKEGSNVGQKIKFETIVPGVVSGDQLFGCFNKISGIWKDGLCSSIFRTFAEDDSTDKKWIIFDGDLENKWAENLYTALDANKTLCLTSGEKILVTNTMSIIFETMNMTEVSPAILSRCGVIYIETSSINWRPYIMSHISKHSIYNGHEEILYTLFDWAVEPCLKFIRNNCNLNSNVGQLHLVMSMLNLFEMYVKDACAENSEEKERVGHFVIWAQAALLLSIVHGLGGSLNSDCHTRFNAFCISLWNGANEGYQKPEAIKNFEITLPNECLIQDNFYIFKGVGNWKSWSDLLKGEKTLEMPNCNRLFVPTINTIKYTSLLFKHVKYRKPFVLFGGVAIGKTSIVQNLLRNKLPEDKYFPNFFSFTSLDSVTKTQKSILSRLYKIKRRHYGPPRDKFCINFVDDLYFEIQEKSETPNILQLLRQYLSYGYLYDVNEPEKILIHDTMFSLAVTVAQGKNNICPRVLRHFNLYTMHEPPTDAIFKIYSNKLFFNLKKNLFAADVLNSVNSITNATINIYNSVVKTLRPIPSKFQYYFNVRDIGTVINGCSLLHKESVETKLTFVRLWVHETWRVFADRMWDTGDKEWLFSQIRQTVKGNFKDSFETAFDYLPKYENNQITKESFNDLMFGNLTDADKTGKTRRYEEIGSMETLKNKIASYLNEYNSKFKKRIDIVMSRYILDCFVKISRVLATPASSLLIISAMGSGRRSITNLAAYAQQQNFFEPSVQSYSNLNLWKEDLKVILRECGGCRKDLTFFLSGKQMKDAFLRDVSSLLATGEIPDLFSAEDRQSIVEAVRLDAQSGDRNAEISIRAVMNYFVEQCKSNLHIVLSFSPSSKAFKSHLSRDPNLLKYCTIHWYDEWPEDALMQIGTKHMQDVSIQENIKPSITQACVKFYEHSRETSKEYHQETGRIIHVTSTSFLHMLKLYTRLTTEKQRDIVTTRNRYLAGLEKLELAAQQVEEMKATLTILKPKLEMSAQQTMITMKEVENENVSVEKATILVKQEEEVANEKAEIAGALKTECEADLAVAIPILEDAIAALNTLKPTDITLVKAMKNPPDTVKLVMAAVCVMLNVPPDRTIDPVTGKKYTDYWGPSKRILGDMNFLQNLKDYDKDNIAPAVMQIIKKTYMTDNSFMPHIVAKASSAAEGLCKWVRAMVSYDEVAKVVAPKKEKLFAAQRECDEAEAFLNEKRRTLSALNAKLAALNNSLQETLQQKLKLEREVENCTAKLKKAENLIASLGGEKYRWMQCAENLQRNYETLAGDMVLSCAVIAYVASYDITFRNKILEYWKKYMGILKVPYSKEYNFISVLGLDHEINHWYFCGLPKDRFSTENAIIMNNSELCCLFIDSQNQANLWIKRIERRNDLKVVKLTDPDWMPIIRSNVENGIPTLIENVGEKLDIQLDPFLLKTIYKDDQTWYMDTGRDVIKHSEDFRLYITTRLLNPHYSREIFSKLTIIDFSIPKEALEDRLLDMVISKEKPELQEKFEELSIEDAANKKILKQQEENILSTLSSTTTNILEDESAIQILDASKNLSLNVIKKQEAANLMSVEISKFRVSYIKFVKHSAGLFSTLNALSYLNHMYRFSFSWFIQLYVRSIETSNRSVVLEKRLEFLKSSFTQNLHLSVCRSLSEKHKILYSFLLCSKTLQDERKASAEEIQFFMSPNSEHFDEASNSAPSWLPSNIWKKIRHITNALQCFHGLSDDFLQNAELWEKYYNSEPLQSRLIPKPWIDKLSEFQTLLLVKTVRPDKIVVQILQLIASVMGETIDYPPRIKISQSYAESSCLTPLIFILPSSSSPLSLLSTYAGAKGYSSKLFSLSMGEGQEQRATVLIKEAQREGGWIFIQNCHLASQWMIQLEKLIENSKPSNVSLDFRLWLSSYPSKDFPLSVLLNSIKITHDCPLSVNQNLLSIYQSDPVRSKEFFESCPGKDKAFSKLLFGLCFFHIVATERKFFGVQGWNIPYEFDHSDLKISITQLRDLINDNEHIPFEMLSHLVGECNYGGKMMDEFDEKCLRSLLEYYLNAEIVRDDHYTFSSEFEYLIPQRCEYYHVIKCIKEMPLNLSPQVLGSTKNGIIIKDTNTSKEFISSIYCTNQIPSYPNDNLVEDQVSIIIDDIRSKLSNWHEIDELAKEYSTVPSEPLKRVLFYEIEILSKILKTAMDSLCALKLALDGHALLSESMQELANELHNGKVPRLWNEFQTNIVIENLAYYVSNLVKRVDFIKDWTNKGHIRIVKFDALFSCNMFLSSCALTFSKFHEVPIDKVEFDFKIVSESSCDLENSDAYFIHGLRLSGARWNFEKEIMEESYTNVLWQDMPPVRFECSQRRSSTHESYDCPVYLSTIQRSVKSLKTNITNKNNYIISIPLRTDLHCTHWIKCGIALFCHTP